MTMNLLNNSLFNNNYSIFDPNLLSYSLILGSLSILSYSIYYGYTYSVGFVSPSESKVLKTLSLKDNPDHDNILRESLINKISINTNKDLSIPQVKTEELVDTTSGYLETGVQTDIKMLYDYMNELIYNDATPVTSLGEMEPDVFAELLANDPQGPAYLQHIQKWVDNVPSSSSSSSSYGSHTSEINFIRQVLESMKSKDNSPIEQLSNSLPENISSIPQLNIESIRETKLNEIIKYVNDKYPTTTSDPFITDWIKDVVDQYDYLQLLSTVCQTEIINKINCNIIIWSCGIF
jgi:hypothetical protein